jgi:hypothetical protein
MLNTKKQKDAKSVDEVSICPAGEVFPLPTEDDYRREFSQLQKMVKAQRQKGREIVVVMGVGFVGAVMAGVVADSVDAADSQPSKFVIGMQRPSTRSYWKIPYLNRGIAPVEAEDPEVAPMIKRCVKEKKTLRATFTYDALTLADVVIVDVQCDYHKEMLGNVQQGRADIAALEDSLKIIGEKINPKCLVLIETTVPPGTTEYIAYPIIKKAFEKRGIQEAEPLLAHSFERVMPGRNYVSSIRDIWRVCSGINDDAREKVTRFLSDVLHVDKFPLTVLDRPIESDHRKFVSGDYSRISGRMECFCRTKRRRSDQSHRCHKSTPDPFKHHFSRTRHRRVLPAKRRWLGGLGLSHPDGI